MIARARTIALVRLLRSVPLTRAKVRRGRVPRQAQPDHIRLAYFRALLPVTEAARAAFLQELPHIAREHREWYREQHPDARRDAARLDAPSGAARAKAAKAAIDRAAKRAAEIVKPQELFDVARQFGKRTTDFQKEQLDRQVRAAVGVPYSAIEKPTRDRVEGWAAVNVDLIKTVPDRYFDRLRQDVEEAYETGMGTDELIEHFEDDYGIQEDDAARIARDQIGKLNGLVNQDRQEALGVERFIWRTMNDQRVRDSHDELDGNTYEWDDPPVDEQTGEQVIPGQAIQCRCYGEPVLSDILDD